MKSGILRITALAGAVLLLAACGGSGPGACADEKAAQKYSQAFIDDMIDATRNGKLSVDQQKALSTQINEMMSAPNGDLVTFCEKLDQLRTQYGI